MDNKTWVTEIVAFMLGVEALILALGVELPAGVSTAVMGLVTIGIRVGLKIWR